MTRQIEPKNYKIIIVGASFAGKTSIARKYVNDEFENTLLATIGIDLLKKIIDVDGENIKLDIWDTAGQERFLSITKSYYRSANGILLVFDLFDVKSFNCVDRWFDTIEKEVSDNVPIFLIGNKFDQVENKENFNLELYQNKAISKNVKFFPASAKTGLNIDKIFLEMAKECKKYARPQDYDSDTLEFNSKSGTKKGKWRKKCC